MSRKVWFLFLLCHLFLFDGTLSKRVVMIASETEAPETTGAPTTNAKIKQTSFSTHQPETTTTQLPVTGEIQDGKNENPEVPLIPRESLEKPLPKKRGISESSYQPGNFDETGYDGNEDAGPDESFSASKSDFEEKPFYKYGDAAFVSEDGYFENEGRTKRTADADEIYNKEPKHVIELTVDELAGLMGYLESRIEEEERERPLPDPDNVLSIEEDMRDEEARNRDPGRYDHLVAAYLSRLKGIDFGRVRRNSMYEHQRSNTPSYRRLILSNYN